MIVGFIVGLISTGRVALAMLDEFASIGVMSPVLALSGLGLGVFSLVKSMSCGEENKEEKFCGENHDLMM